MSDEAWDAEDFEPPARVTVVTDRWEGEDEDADVKDNWDEEDEEPAKPTDNGEVSAVQTKKKKSLKEIIAEKEEKKRKEQEEKKKQEEEMTPLTAQEIAAEKLRQQKLQEESDLILAVEAFGVGADTTVQGLIDGMEPSSKEDFDKFEEVLREKIIKFAKSPHYLPFLENLYRQLAIDLEAEDIKRLGSTLTALSNEKVKQQKSTKGKQKKKQKATLLVGKETDAVLDEGGYDDYDDFI
jgi:translation initiation factor 3 subunit J